MTYQAENTAIESRFYTNWGSRTTIKYDNVDFRQPNDACWVELIIHDGASIPISIGNGIVHRTVGIISINIYAPLNSGTKVSKGHADFAAAIFRGQQFSTITCRGASVTRLGEKDGWHVTNVSIDFFRDEEF